MRLITRGDMDGLTCTVFLTLMEKIDEIKFTHPKDLQDGRVEITSDDIIANLPYHPHCAMWFDHHLSEEKALEGIGSFKGKYGLAPSAARLIYDYYQHPARGGSEETLQGRPGRPDLKRFEELLEATDRMDSAQLTVEDVTNPTRYILLLYTLDPRTGLGKFQDYFLKLVAWIKKHPIEEILKFPEVKTRCDRILTDQERFKQALLQHSRQEANVIITDFRGVGDLPIGNRFLIYTLFPRGNISIRLFDGKDRKFVVAALGHSIFNRTSNTNIAQLLRKYGGGGHRGAGTCQLSLEEAEGKIAEIIQQMKADG